jgi:hypothetical protein
MSPLARPFSALGLAVVVLLAGCSGCSSSTSSATASGSGSGSGDCKAGKNAAFAAPAGAPFALPAGLTLSGEITGDFQPTCTLQSDPIEYGGDALIMCLGLKNATAAEIKVKLPAGLFFLAKAADGANGLILQDHVLTVAANTTTYFKFNLFTANKTCSVGRATDRYAFGNVTSDAKLGELIALASHVALTYGHTDEAGAFVQAVWDITDGDGVTADHRAAIDRLPKI